MTQIIHIRDNNCNEFISIDFLHIDFKSFDTLIAEWLNDTWVTVSDKTPHVTPNDDNICNVITDGRYDVVTVTCDYKNRNPPLRGRYVTIRRKDDANERNFLNFCEVEVLSCRPGFWGKDSANEDCSQSCGHCVEQTCRVLDGYCYTVCQGGYWGANCNKDCNCGRFTGCTSIVPRESHKKNNVIPHKCIL